MNILNTNLHTPHCRRCKERVGELLVRIYGLCRTNETFPWATEPAAYRNTTIGAALENIRSALAEFRGHGDFIKTPQLPPCDFFISDPPFILEFDESQHFTRPRLIALDHYPADAQVGFPVSRWQELCREIDARDGEPFDRDERRAWYDSLRDLVPATHGFKPTVRIYAGDFPWCQFDVFSGTAQTKLQTILADHFPD